MTTIAEEVIDNYIAVCHNSAVAKGFYDNISSRSEKIKEILLCLHMETSEAAECLARGTMEYTVDENGKPHGFESELADVFIYIMDLCGYMGFNLYDAIEAKIRYNAERAYKHGKNF